jgi:menaquinone reductase, multiheme cytochrome c subunit
MNARGVAWAGAGFVIAFTAGWLAYPRAFYRSEAQPLAFNHLVHTGDAAGLTCDACHTLSAEGRFEGIPVVAVCAGCHASPIGTSDAERLFVERFIVPGTEIPWKSYWRQPDNAWFSHAIHVRKGEVACTECHGDHGSSTRLEDRMVNRLTGYPRNVDRVTLAGVVGSEVVGMKMDRCTGCHRSKGFRSGCISCHK